MDDAPTLCAWPPVDVVRFKAATFTLATGVGTGTAIFDTRLTMLRGACGAGASWSDASARRDARIPFVAMANGERRAADARRSRDVDVASWTSPSAALANLMRCLEVTPVAGGVAVLEVKALSPEKKWSPD